MRTERDILDLIARALHEKEVKRRREAERLAEETERRRVFLQAARAVFTHVIMPEMERFGGVLHVARLRSSISDTGAFYLPGSADATLLAKFSLPMPREQIELPLCVAFEAVFPVGIAVYFCNVDSAEESVKGPAEQVSLEDVTPQFVEDRLVRVLENYLHEM